MRSEKLPDKQVNRLSVKLGYLRIEKWPIAFLYLIFLSLNNLQNVAANSVSIRPIRNDRLKGKCYISTYSHGYQLLNFMQGMGKLLSDIPYLFPQELKANFEVFLNVNIFSTSNLNSLLTRKKITP